MVYIEGTEVRGLGQERGAGVAAEMACAEVRGMVNGG